MNCENKEVNTSIGCNVTECKFNRCDYCTLAKIHVGNACNSSQCTCCDSYEKR